MGFKEQVKAGEFQIMTVSTGQENYIFTIYVWIEPKEKI